MKKGNTLIVIFASLSIAALLALSAILTLYMMDDTNPLKKYLPFYENALNGGNNDLKSADGQQADDIYSDQAKNNSAVNHDNSFILVGDSRTVAMKEAMKSSTDSTVYIAKEGEGYEWFKETGLPELKSTLAESPTKTVVFNLGVNDVENISLYLTLYKELVQSYPDVSFYFMSVNPVNEEKAKGITNAQIQNFNGSLQEIFSTRYLDCYNYMIQNGFDTVDGLHYTQDTSKDIHQYLMDQIFHS
ncbi:hypothetical protein [uncultured Robinsoniella sp.]|uniref:hypothetical protein n=1 Tax=uncultured Robinsoniella sp. TaxID=904190 RepID=UPI00374E3C45